MNRLITRFVIVISLLSVSISFGVEPAYREVQVSFAYGVSSPSGNWKSVMESGQSLGVDLGLAVSSRASVGLHFGYGDFDTKFKQLGPLEAETSDNNWTRYVGGLFGEYRLTDSSISPFIGVGAGVHAVHVAYVEVIEGVDGEGDFGFGFGFATGLQYRNSPRLGAVLRFDFENSPSMTDGWFMQAQLGVKVFL